MDQEKCLCLIEMYKNVELLWNPKLKEYHNTCKREDAWKDISVNINIPVPELKAKMKSLLGTYRREKSRIKKSRITGSGTDSIYESKWFAYDSFDFLMDRDNSRDTMDTMHDESQEEEATETPPLASPSESTPHTTDETPDECQAETPSFQTPNTNGNKKRSKPYTGPAPKRKRGGKDDDEELLGQAFKMLKTSNQLSTDSYFTYGQHIANELRKYDAHTLALVKREFSKTLFEADVGRLGKQQFASTTSSHYGTRSMPGSPTVSTQSSLFDEEINEENVFTLL